MDILSSNLPRELSERICLYSIHSESELLGRMTYIQCERQWASQPDQEFSSEFWIQVSLFNGLRLSPTNSEYLKSQGS